MNITPTPPAAPEPAPGGTPTPASRAPKRSHKLPLKEVTIRPKDELRVKILQICHETGKSAPAVLEALVAQAAGLKPDWIIVRPQCGPNAGVSLQRVEGAMKHVFCTLRDAKGVIATHGNDQQRASVDNVYSSVLELWAIAQSLSKDTFYNREELEHGRQTFKLVSKWHHNSSKEMSEEQSKGDAGNTKKIDECKNRLVHYAATIEVLKRLGFSPGGVLP